MRFQEQEGKTPSITNGPKLFLLGEFHEVKEFIWSAFANDSIRVERFGHKGDLTPSFMGQPLPDSFFTSHKTRALTIAQHYTASMTVPKTFEAPMIQRSKLSIPEHGELFVGNEL